MEPFDLPSGIYTLAIDKDASKCGTHDMNHIDNMMVSIENERSTILYFWLNAQTDQVHCTQSQYENLIEKPEGGRPNVKVIWSLSSQETSLNEVRLLRNNKTAKATTIELGNATDHPVFGDTEAEPAGKPADYVVYLNDEEIDSITLKQGANYNLLLIDGAHLFHQVHSFGFPETFNKSLGDTREQCEHVLADSTVCYYDCRRNPFQHFYHGILLYSGIINQMQKYRI